MSSLEPDDARAHQREQREKVRERNRRSSAEQRALKVQREMARVYSNGAAVQSTSSSSPSPRTKADARLTLKQLNAASVVDEEETDPREEEEDEEEAEEEDERLPSSPPLPPHPLQADLLSVANGLERTVEEGEADTSLSAQPQPQPSALFTSPLDSALPASSAFPFVPAVAGVAAVGLVGGSEGRTAAAVENPYERRFEHADPFARRASSSSSSQLFSHQPSLLQLREAVSAHLERLSEEQLRLWLTQLIEEEVEDDSDKDTDREGEEQAKHDPAHRATTSANQLVRNGTSAAGAEEERRMQSRHSVEGRSKPRRSPLFPSSDVGASRGSHGDGRPHAPQPAMYSPAPALSPISSSASASLLSSTFFSSSSSVSRLPSSHVHRDWNEDFQTLLSQVNDDETVLDQQTAFEQLSELAADFAFTARAIGRLIISEKYLAPAQKTIKPLTDTMGGSAGGEKYCVHNIVFKFTVDHLGMYGGDEQAMAAGNHELLGLSAYYRVISTMKGLGLHVPLACLIDYRGFRLWAVSRLPVVHGGEQSTLILGSSDGGQRIVNLDPNVSVHMQRIAAVLNLKGHYVHDASGKATFLFGPFDIEVHCGTDRRVYLLDFHRTFPPEPTHSSQHLPDMKKPFLVRMLRPELVAQHDRPLSSDAFLRGGAAEEAEVTRAYQSLLEKVIPAFAHQLDSLGSIDRIDRISTLHQQQTEQLIEARAFENTPTRSSSTTDTHTDADGVERADATSPFGLISRSPSPSPNAALSPVPSPPPSPGRAARSMTGEQLQVDPIAYAPRFISYLHQAGINIRHLGLLRSAVKTPSIRDFLLVEMLARVLKGDMRKRWRERMAVVKHLSDGDRRCSLDFVNLVFFRSAASTAYWHRSIKRRLQDKFQQALSKEEAAVEFDLKAALLPMPDERDAGPSPFSPTASSSTLGGGRQLHALPADPFLLSAASQERLNRLLRTASTNPSSSSSTLTDVASAASSPSQPTADAPSTPPHPSTVPLVRSVSSMSTPASRADLLRLVFLRFIHLTGLVVQEGLIPGPQRVYNEPSVPLPLAQVGASRWAERTRSGNWDSQQLTGDSPGSSHPVSPSSTPSLPATHPLSLPPRLPSNAGGLRRPGHGSSHQLPTVLNLRSQTTQPSSSSSLPRSSSSTSLQPSHSPHRPKQFSFGGSSSALLPSSGATESSLSSTLESSSYSSLTSSPPSPFFLFYERPMEDVHLSSITEQVKSLNIVSYAEGTALLCKCLSKARREDGSAADDPQNAALAAYLADLSQAKFRESLRRDVDDCLSLCNFSMLASLVYRDMEQAKGLLLSALRANPRHHRSYYYLAQLFSYDLKKPRIAEWLYRQADKLNPQHVNTHKDWGNLLYFWHHNKREAEEHYRIAVQLQPNHIKAQMRLGWCLAEKAKEWGQFEEVLQCFRAAANSHYGEQTVRSKAQATFLSMLLIKGQLHAERKEDARAVECFEEAIAFRPPALMPYQVAQPPQLGLHFPPAAALAVCAQFEVRRQWRLNRAEQLKKAELRFLQAIHIQTQLSVDYANNALVLAVPPPTLSSQPSHLLSSSSSPPLSRAPAPTGSHSGSLPAAGFVPTASSSVPRSPQKPAATAAVGSVLAASPTAAVNGKVQHSPKQAVLSVALASSSSPASSLQRMAPAAPSPPAMSSAAPPTAGGASPAPPRPVPSSALATAAASPKGAWSQPRPWLPDLATPHPVPSPHELRRQRVPSKPLLSVAVTPATPSSPAASPARPAPSASSPSAPPVTAASLSTLHPTIPESNGKEEAVGSETASDAGSADVGDGDVDDDEANELSQPPSPTASEVLEGETIGSIPRARDETQRSSTSSTTAVSSSHAQRQSSAAAVRELSEADERGEEERKERSCVDTRLVRLYADHLHHLGEVDAAPQMVEAARRWYLTAINLCPFGRQGSLNYARYANCLGRTLHLQYDAQRAFHRAIASPCPAREALLTYAAYLKEVLLDEKTAEALIARAQAMKSGEGNAEHRCQRTKARWYCDGYCQRHDVKPLIDMASHWRLERHEGGGGGGGGVGHSAARSQQGQRQRPQTAAPTQPQPRRSSASAASHSPATRPGNSPTVKPSATPAPVAPASVGLPPSPASASPPAKQLTAAPSAAVTATASAPSPPTASPPSSSATGGYTPLSFSPPSTPTSASSSTPLQPRASWAAVCQLSPVHSGGQPPARPAASPPPTLNASHTGGFSPPPLSTPAQHLPPTLSLAAFPTGSPPVRVTALPVFTAPRPVQSVAVKAKGAATPSPSTGRPTVPPSPMPFPMPGPSPSRTARG